MHHHYVPIFYLKFWANGRDEKVSYFARYAGKLVRGRVAPRSTGYEPGLYALDKVSEERRNEIEQKFFSPLDSAAAPLHKRMEARDRIKFTPMERATWAQFLFAANVRVPDRVQYAKELGSRLLRASLEVDPDEFQRAKGSAPEQTLVEWVTNNESGLIENIGLGNLTGFLSRIENLRHILDLEWTLHTLPKDGQRFLTCDRPFLHTGKPDDPDFTIAFPLSPRSLFVAAKTFDVAERMRAMGPRRLANHINDFIVRNAVLRVYGEAQHNFVDPRFRSNSPLYLAPGQAAPPSA